MKRINIAQDHPIVSAYIYSESACTVQYCVWTTVTCVGDSGIFFKMTRHGCDFPCLVGNFSLVKCVCQHLHAVMKSACCGFSGCIVLTVIYLDLFSTIWLFSCSEKKLQSITHSVVNSLKTFSGATKFSLANDCCTFMILTAFALCSFIV